MARGRKRGRDPDRMARVGVGFVLPLSQWWGRLKLMVGRSDVVGRLRHSGGDGMLKLALLFGNVSVGRNSHRI
jgi:hypothetical protein